MTPLRLVRYVVWALVPVALIVLGYAVLRPNDGGDEPEIANVNVEIGVPFGLITAAGEPITEADIRGHPSLMFFGYTHCPDFCPTALAEVSSWLTELGSDAEDLVVYFVTVDPERDQPESLNAYLSVFDPRIVGITGPVDDVHAMLDGYRVAYYRYEDEALEGYLMDHYTSFYRLDRNGSFQGSIGFSDTREEALQLVRRLIDER